MSNRTRFGMRLSNGYIVDEKKIYKDKKDFIKECKIHYPELFETGDNFHKNVKIKYLRFSGIHECYYITKKSIGAFEIYEVDTDCKDFGKL